MFHYIFKELKSYTTNTADAFALLNNLVVHQAYKDIS